MSELISTMELLKPKKSPKLSNHDLLYGTPMSPIQKLSTMSDDVYEDLVLCWANEYLSNEYLKVRRCAGAGDKGRDVIGMIDEVVWDNYQCKHYIGKLTPTEFYIELGKLCYYTFHSHYSIPRFYYIVSKEGVGTKLFDLINKPEDLKTGLINNWEKYVKTKITSTKEIELITTFKEYVEKFDFSIVKIIEPIEFLDQFSKTSYHLYYFGGGIKKYRSDTIVPLFANAEEEMRYVKQLLKAYGEAISEEINSVSDLSIYGEYKVHFELQRKNFYSIETLKAFERDNLPPESTAFDDLKDEILSAVYPKIFGKYEHAFMRLNEILQYSSLLSFESNPLKITISVLDKQGMCHHLVNESKLSWIL